MSPLAVLALLALQGEPASPGAPAPPESPASPAARGVAFRVEPQEVEVGLPFDLVVAVRHRLGEPVPALGTDGLEQELGWVLLGRTREAAVPDDETEGFVWTRYRLTLAALEPGEEVLPVFALTLGGEPLRPFPELPPEEVLASLPHVTVSSALGEGEDAPRPLRGLGALQADIERAEGTGLPPWVVGAAAAAALLAAAWWLLARRRRRPRVLSAPSPEDELSRLASTDARDPEAVRALHFDLTRLVRRALDREHERAGLDDDAWVRRMGDDPGLPADARRALEELLDRCRLVKYAGDVPTEWALRETLERARLVLAAAHGDGAAAGARRSA